MEGVLVVEGGWFGLMVLIWNVPISFSWGPRGGRGELGGEREGGLKSVK